MNDVSEVNDVERFEGAGTLGTFIESMFWVDSWTDQLFAKDIHKIYLDWIKSSRMWRVYDSPCMMAHALRKNSLGADQYIVMVPARVDKRPPKYIPCRRYRDKASAIIAAGEI